MLTKCRLSGLAVLGVVMLLTAMSSPNLSADEVTAPNVTDVKMTSEEWHAVFLEGKNIGYERVQKGTGTVGETKVFLLENREKHFITIDGKTQTVETSDKYIMKAGFVRADVLQGCGEM